MVGLHNIHGGTPTMVKKMSKPMTVVWKDLNAVGKRMLIYIHSSEVHNGSGSIFIKGATKKDDAEIEKRCIFHLEEEAGALLLVPDYSGPWYPPGKKRKELIAKLKADPLMKPYTLPDTTIFEIR
jgi:hypothetical protein